MYLSSSISLKVWKIVHAWIMNLFFWLGTKILPYVQFTYFNILSEDPSGSFTKICDVTLPRLLIVTESRFGPTSFLSIPLPPTIIRLTLTLYPGKWLKMILVSRTSASRWGDRYRWCEGGTTPVLSKKNNNNNNNNIQLNVLVIERKL